MTPADLESTLRRPARFWNIDGLPMLGMGALWLFQGGFSLVQLDMARHPSGVGRLVAQYGWVLLVVACFAINPILKRIKARITEPRAGHARMGRQHYWAKRILAGAIAAVVACGACVLVAFAQRNGFAAFERLVPAGTGLIVAGAFLFVARRQSLPSFAWAGLVALLAGFAVSSLSAPLDSFGYLWLALGAACVVLGAFDLRAFLKHHPVAAPEDQA